VTDIPKDVLDAADAAFEDCRHRNEHDHDFRIGTCCLRAAITAALETTAAEQWAEKQADQLGLKYADFRAGKWEMELSMAREMGAAYTAMAKTLLGDAPNYTETKISFDTKIAESPEMYTLVVQRHAPGVLTPHEARQKAETRVAELEAQLAQAQGEAHQYKTALQGVARRAATETPNG
jgi:hypothetical protein